MSTDDADPIRQQGPGHLSDEAKAARRPLPPEDLVEARHDRIHKDVGRAVAAKLPKRRHTDTVGMSQELADLLREPPRDPEALPCNREAERLLADYRPRPRKRKLMDLAELGLIVALGVSLCATLTALALAFLGRL